MAVCFTEPDGNFLRELHIKQRVTGNLQYQVNLGDFSQTYTASRRRIVPAFWEPPRLGGSGGRDRRVVAG